jgi:hypothetical protein
MLKEDVTRALLIGAARDRRMVTYTEVAAASGVPWHAAFRRITRHLSAVNAACIARGEPMLGCLVTKRDGRISEKALDSIATHAFQAGRMTGTGRAEARRFVAAERKAIFEHDWSRA